MKRLALIAAALAALGVGLAPPAHAADAPRLTIRQVDATQWPTVRVQVLASGAAVAAPLSVRDDGRLLDSASVTAVAAPVTLATVIVIDESASMVGAGRLEGAVGAVRGLVDRMAGAEQLGIVAFGDQARIVAPLTSDRTVLLHAVDSLRPHGGSALWDGVRLATGMLQAARAVQPNIVVVSDGKDNASESTGAVARASVLAAKAVVFAAGVGGGALAPPEPDGLSALAEVTGGQYRTVAVATDLPAVYAGFHATLHAQREVTFTAAGTEPRDVTLSLPGATVTALVVPGSLARGIYNRPADVDRPKAPTLLSGPAGKFIIVGLVLVAGALLAASVAMTLRRPPSELDSALVAYTEAAPLFDDEHPNAPGLSLVHTQVIRRAVDSASRLQISRKVLDSLTAKLEQANVPLRAEEAAFVYGAAGVLLLALAVLFWGPILSLAIGAGLAFLPAAILSFLVRRRQSRFTRQLPDALNLLSGTLRAGFSLMQGIEAMSTEIGDPMGHELRRVLAEARLGRSLDDALTDMAGRLKSPDFEWTVMAIGIQREVGGNLAELLETVADTMKARDRLRRDVKALTAEGRISAIVIGIMPPAMLAVMWAVNRPYTSVLVSTTMGQAILGGSALIAGFGFWWMKKMIEVEV